MFWWYTLHWIFTHKRTYQLMCFKSMSVLEVRQGQFLWWQCLVTCFYSLPMGAAVCSQPGLVITHHADHTLSSFCQWQSGLMGKDGTRHDHAILLTGLDICSWKNAPCDTLGKSLQGVLRAACGMCPSNGWHFFCCSVITKRFVKHRLTPLREL